ncbi:COG5567 Predicted small periplasmic lipoprotein [Methylophilaceae bacterium]
MQKIRVTLLLAMLVFSSLSGCGTKGPLYIPERQYPQPSTTNP